MSAIASPDVSILVISYNTRAMTLAALDSVVSQTRAARFEIIVVDNASNDGSSAAIAAHPSRPRLVALQHNIGFARANALAARHASGRYLLLLNPDTLVIGRAIDRLVAFADATPGARIWGGRTLYADRSLNPGSCWAMMTPWSLFSRATGLAAISPASALCNREAYGGWARDCQRAVDIVSGCFLLVAKADWERLGGFDPRFFMYGEDADLCLRAARELGARPMITPDATILHYGGASERVRADKMVRLLTAKASLIRCHFPAPQVRLGLALLQAWPLSRLVACQVMALVTQSSRWRETAATWGQVWARRKAWRHGYDGATADRNAKPARKALEASEPAQ